MKYKYLQSLTLLSLILVNVSLAQPISKVEGVNISAIVEAPFEALKLSYNSNDSLLYTIAQNGSIYRVNFAGRRTFSSTTEVQNSSNHGLNNVQGMDISTDGKFYIVGNILDSKGNNPTYTNIGVIKRATIDNGIWNWETVATTDAWPISNTDFDHVMNEIVITPDDKMLYINSGSRTDHGEEQPVRIQGGPQEGLYPGLRETPLTAKIFSVPADTTDAFLKNDLDYLIENNFIFAFGTRNSFGMAFDGNGELFSADNAGERDDPGEFNWLQKGKHYGFPWRIGGNDTPMQYPDYDYKEDVLFNAVGREDLFYNDPDYPARPDSIDFIEPILNYGPNGVNYVDYTSGEIMNAFDQDTAISSFTAHRSSLGLIFDRDSSLTGEYTGDPFILAFTGGNDPFFLLRTMNDAGEELMHLELTKIGDTYRMTSKTLVSGFLNPIDTEIIDGEIYVLEFGNSWLNNQSTTRIWKVSFDESVNNEREISSPEQIFLSQNYPNPFNPTTVINYNLMNAGKVTLNVYNTLGQRVETLVNAGKSAGAHQVSFDASSLTSGIYFYTLSVDGNFIQTKKMMLIK